MDYIIDYEKSGKKGEIEKFILLSGSPRRRELLGFLNPEIFIPEIDERNIEKRFMKLYENDDFLTRSAKTCCEISKKKSDIELLDKTMYISADTMVIMGDEIYNKPVDKKDAERMFRSYFGKEHFAVTSVCLRMKDYLDSFYAVAKVEFIDYYKELEDVIRKYLDSSSPLDKAGAYGIQDLDKRFIKSISGDINTIMGFPVAETSYRIFS